MRKNLNVYFLWINSYHKQQMTPRIIFEVHVYLYLETSRVIFNNSEMTFYLQSLAAKSYIHVELIDLLHM